jgi:hypothetical protein
MSDESWARNYIQFPRLIAEIEAAGGFTDKLMQDLQTSMDLTEEDIFELIGRAQTIWDNIKATTQVVATDVRTGGKADE